jgi:uncharacterized membrane protein
MNEMVSTRSAAVLALAIQSLLLFSNLGLLPLWGDELSTLRVSQRPVPKLLDAVRADIHPPLYFLAQHYWMKLPLPSDPVIRMRSMSALVTLIASAAVLWFAWPRLIGSERWWFVALWTVSPCLLLYGRMGRSYSMQLLVAVIAVDRLLKFLKEPASRRHASLFAVASAVVLYTHYAPGLALLAAANLVFLWRFRSMRPMLLPNLAVVLLYLPWIATSIHALSQVARIRENYRVTGSAALEHLVKAGYTGMSFLFGESLPWWLFIVVVLAAPGLVWLALKGAGGAGEWRALLACAAVIGYLGVSRWVTYPFAPARLLFLLPFFNLLVVYGARMTPRLGNVLLSAWLAACLAGVWSYFRVDGYMNWGYAVPYRDIAAEITDDPRSTVALASIFTDVSVLRYYLPPGFPLRSVGPKNNPEAYAAGLISGSWDRICLVRNIHQPSTGEFYERLEAALGARLSHRFYYFRPRTPLDNLMARIAGWPETVPYFYEVIEFTPNGGPSAAGLR